MTLNDACNGKLMLCVYFIDTAAPKMAKPTSLSSAIYCSLSPTHPHRMNSKWEKRVKNRHFNFSPKYLKRTNSQALNLKKAAHSPITVPMIKFHCNQLNAGCGGPCSPNKRTTGSSGTILTLTKGQRMPSENTQLLRKWSNTLLLPLNRNTFKNPQLAYGDGETLGKEIPQSKVRRKCHFVLSICSYELWLMCISWPVPISIPLAQGTSNKKLQIILSKIVFYISTGLFMCLNICVRIVT